MSAMTGTVEKIAYTSGGAGNQWTTISGVRYATYWDVRTIDWKIGDKVSFNASMAALWHGTTPIPRASAIRLANDAATATEAAA